MRRAASVRLSSAEASCGATASKGTKPCLSVVTDGSTSTPTIARTFERHCQQRSSTVSRRPGTGDPEGAGRAGGAAARERAERRPKRRRGSALSCGGTIWLCYWQLCARSGAGMAYLRILCPQSCQVAWRFRQTVGFNRSKADISHSFEHFDERGEI